MTYQIIDQRENVRVTERMLPMYRDIIPATDQFEELKPGQIISTYGFIHEGGQRGQLTVYHAQGRAAIALGGDSDWGDWDHDEYALRLTGPDDTHVWYVRDGRIWEEADVE